MHIILYIYSVVFGACAGWGFMMGSDEGWERVEMFGIYVFLCCCRLGIGYICTWMSGRVDWHHAEYEDFAWVQLCR